MSNTRVVDIIGETIGVKAALKAAGLTGISVSHGHGTSWGWLYVKVDSNAELAEQVAREFTGRHGERADILVTTN